LFAGKNGYNAAATRTRTLNRVVSHTPWREVHMLRIAETALTFDDVLRKGLKVMDTTAFTLSQENELPIIVFDMNTHGNLLKLLNGENIGN